MNEKTKKKTPVKVFGLTPAGELAAEVSALEARITELEAKLIQIGKAHFDAAKRIGDLELAIGDGMLGGLAHRIETLEAAKPGAFCPEQVADVVVAMVERHAIRRKASR